MAHRDPGRVKCSGTWIASATGLMDLSESFFQPLVAGDQKASLVSLSPYLHPFRHLEGSLARGLSLLLGASGTQRGPLPGIPLCRLVHQAHKGAPCVWSYSVVQGISCLMGQPLYCSAASAGGWGNGSTPYT